MLWHARRMRLTDGDLDMLRYGDIDRLVELDADFAALPDEDKQDNDDGYRPPEEVF